MAIMVHSSWQLKVVGFLLHESVFYGRSMALISVIITASNMLNLKTDPYSGVVTFV